MKANELLFGLMAAVLSCASAQATEVRPGSAQIHAYDPVCTPEQLKFAGVKATMQMEIPQSGSTALTEAFRRYALSHNLGFWTGGINDPQNGYSSITSGLQSHSIGIIITIVTDNRTQVARIELRKTCIVDEEWQPYWYDLTAFITARNYRRISN